MQYHGPGLMSGNHNHIMSQYTIISYHVGSQACETRKSIDGCSLNFFFKDPSFQLLINVYCRMKYLIIPNLWSVGMHHWGSRQLEVGMGYRVEREPENPKDPNAVAILYDGERKAYLKKNHAFLISKILKMKISNTIRLKPKEDAVVKSKNIGPQQSCTVGFKVKDDINLKPAQDLFSMKSNM